MGQLSFSAVGGGVREVLSPLPGLLYGRRGFLKDLWGLVSISHGVLPQPVQCLPYTIPKGMEEWAGGGAM